MSANSYPHVRSHVIGFLHICVPLDLLGVTVLNTAFVISIAYKNAIVDPSFSSSMNMVARSASSRSRLFSCSATASLSLCLCLCQLRNGRCVISCLFRSHSMGCRTSFFRAVLVDLPDSSSCTYRTQFSLPVGPDMPTFSSSSCGHRYALLLFKRPSASRRPYVAWCCSCSLHHHACH